MGTRNHAHGISHVRGQTVTRKRIVQLESVDEGYHPLALVRIGQVTAHGAEIVRHVRRVGGAGNDRRDPFVGEQVFEKERVGCMISTARSGCWVTTNS